MASTWSSVMSRPVTPLNQITFDAPKASHIAASICAVVMPGLRFLLTRLLLVAMSVPLPSVSTAPPSPTKSAVVSRTPASAAMRSATSESLAWVCLLPQPLKFRSTASRPPAPSVRKTGPLSRIQQSSTGIEPITVTACPQALRACGTAAELAHMVTGSYVAIVFAMRAMFAWTPASLRPQMAVLSGHAIHVRVCGTVSSGTANPEPAAGTGVASALPPPVRAQAAPAAARPVAARKFLLSRRRWDGL